MIALTCVHTLINQIAHKIENEWHDLLESTETVGPVNQISMAEILSALNSMKDSKAGGPTGITKEHLTASSHGAEVLKQIGNELLEGGEMPEDWKVSTLVPIYKGKGSVLECGSYRGVKLLEQGMKVIERVFERRMREIVEIDKRQFGFMPGRGTTDAIFGARRMQEVYVGRKKNLFMCFVDLEKAFDRVPRRVIEWAMRRRGVPELLVRAVMKMYEGAETKVRCGNTLSDSFPVHVGVHQGSVLSPLLFAVVIDVLSEDCRKDGLWNLLYADDLVLMCETIEELEELVLAWKVAFEGKGLKVNMAKTKVMQASGGKGVTVEAKEDPCGVCGKRVKENLMECTRCRRWVRARCAKVKKVNQQLALSFICSKCVSGEDLLENDGQYLEGVERVQQFSYLGDMMNEGGGCEIAVSRRCHLGWARFNELAGILCGRRFTWKLRGKVFKACVRSVMVYGSETWNVKGLEAGVLQRMERAMIRRMCGVKLEDRKNTLGLMERLGLNESILEVVKRNGLRWMGHVLRREDNNPIKMAWQLDEDVVRGRGRPKMTWKDNIKKEARKCGLKEEDAKDRARWRARLNVNEGSNPSKDGTRL